MYWAKYEIGGCSVQIREAGGSDMGRYTTSAPIVNAAALGPRIFAFNLSDGRVYIIDALTCCTNAY